jgi:hypothetical protein
MEYHVRAAILVLLSYIAYWCVFGTSEEVMRAIKMVYYFLNLVENGRQLHG